MKLAYLFTWVLGSILLPAAAQAQQARSVYISPTGDDANPGTEARPFRTLEKARETIRTAASQGATVYLRGGAYTLDRAFVLGPEDSGSAGAPVVYQAYMGEKPVLSGGARISGWRDRGAGLWQAAAPIPDFRQLYVNGRRAMRARGPVPPGARFEGRDGVFTSNAAVAKWGNPQDIELVFDIQWERDILKVLKIEPVAGGAVFRMLEPYFTLARMKEGKQIELPTHIENALELVDEPGEWYLDRARPPSLLQTAAGRRHGFRRGDRPCA